MKLTVSTLLLASVIGSSAADSGTAFFEKEIVPILERRCFECHSHASGKAKGGLVWDSRVGWEKGGSQPAIVPGKPEESLMVAAIGYGNKDLQMPPSG